jgi:hypothetical protein
MFGYFIRHMLPHKIHPPVTGDRGERAHRSWACVRCHHPGCSYFHPSPFAVQHHIEHVHGKMAADIQELGWFWGTIRTIVRINPETTIAAALGEGELPVCLAPRPQRAAGQRVGRCLKACPSEQFVRMHFG